MGVILNGFRLVRKPRGAGAGALRQSDWFGDDDQAVGIVGVRPTGDQRQALIRRWLNPLRILAANCEGLIAIEQDETRGDFVHGQLIARVNLDQIAGFEIDQMPEDLTCHVVMSVKDGIARLSQQR